MNYGGGGISFVSNTASAGGGITGANNGLTVNAGIVQHGGPAGSGTGFLLHDTTEILNGFDLLLGDDLTNEQVGLYLSPGNLLVLLGNTQQFNGATTDLQLQINQSLQQVNIGQPKPSPFGDHRYFSVDASQFWVTFGDLDNFFTNQFIATLDYNSQRFFVGRSGPTFFNVDAGNGVYQLGDLVNVNNGVSLIMDDTLNRVQFGTALGEYFLLDIAAGNFQIGDIGGVTNSTVFTINDVNKSFIASVGTDLFFGVDVANHEYFLGDFNGTNKQTYLRIADNSQIIKGVSQFGGMFIFDGGNRLYQIGDLDAFFNNTVFEINDQASAVTVKQFGSLVFNLDGAGQVYEMGDIGGFNQGSHISIIDSTSQLLFNDNGGTIFTADLNGITTQDPASGPGIWRLGMIQTTASVLDTTKYVEVRINGTLTKLATMV